MCLDILFSNLVIKTRSDPRDPFSDPVYDPGVPFSEVEQLPTRLLLDVGPRMIPDRQVGTDKL